MVAGLGASQDSPLPQGSPELSAADKVAQWSLDTPDMMDPSAPPIEPPETVEVDADVEGMTDLEHLLPYFSSTRSFITQAEAFSWLVGQIRRLLLLDCASAYSLQLPSQVIGDAPRSTQEMKLITFVVEWDPVSFLRDQYGSDLPTLLGQVITKTGMGDRVQATTCSEYLEQVWPKSGTQLLAALQGFLVGNGKQRKSPVA